MLTSLNGKTTGPFSREPEIHLAIKNYEIVDNSFQSQAYLSGRVSMEENFTGFRVPEFQEDAKVLGFAVLQEADGLTIDENQVFEIQRDRLARLFLGEQR